MHGNTKKMIPAGIENFEKLRAENFYYIDKTGMISQLLAKWGEVNLFTRPRRFGKSLNMSMLQHFFEQGTQKWMFEGLKISEDTELCEKYMGRYPVISVTLKGISAGCYETALDMAALTVSREAGRHQYLCESGSLTEREKESFCMLLKPERKEHIICDSLRLLSELLEKHHGKKAILLIDEYDVPLAKAFANGYYDQMVLFMQSLFGQTLKTNHSLQFAVLTGCLRIAKESIFTGLNNLKVFSVTDARFDEYFGFTDQEVRELLEYYDLSDAYEDIREWYDGYQFGNKHIYCPWDVLNYCDLLCSDSSAAPQDYWSNTGSSDVIRHFLEKSRKGTAKQEIERLVAGEAVKKKIRQDLTYQDLYRSMENIWSVLFTTGYLTQKGKPDGDLLWLAIPNMEIRRIFTEQIMELFKESVQKDGEAVEKFCDALKNGDVQGVEEQFGRYLKKSVSIRDTFVKKQMKENYYHGILMGLLAYRESWAVFSNQESGRGYSDILIEIEDEETGIVIEVKYPDGGSLEQGCLDALHQIEENRYEERLLDDGMHKIIKYGIACHKKQCRAAMAR